MHAFCILQEYSRIRRRVRPASNLVHSNHFLQLFTYKHKVTVARPKNTRWQTYERKPLVPGLQDVAKCRRQESCIRRRWRIINCRLRSCYIEHHAVPSSVAFTQSGRETGVIQKEIHRKRYRETEIQRDGERKREPTDERYHKRSAEARQADTVGVWIMILAYLKCYICYSSCFC